MLETVVVGGGAVGLFLYSRLRAAGLCAKLALRRKAQKEALTCTGLRLTGVEESEVKRVEMLLPEEELSGFDVVFFCTKAYDVQKALDQWVSLLKKGAAAIFVQNGLGFWEALRKKTKSCGAFPYALSITFGLTKVSDAHVEVRGEGQSVLGALGHEAPHQEDLVQLFSKARLNPRWEEPVENFLYKKALVNSIINPIAAILEVKNGFILHPTLEPLIRQCWKECRMFYPFEEETFAFVLEVARRTASNTCSMLQDIRNQRLTEIDYLNAQFPGDTHKLLTLLVKAKSNVSVSHHASA